MVTCSILSNSCRFKVSRKKKIGENVLDIYPRTEMVNFDPLSWSGFSELAFRKKQKQEQEQEQNSQR